VLENGQGVPADPRKAEVFYRKACDENRGDADGCVGLGTLALSGAAGKVDPAAAIAFFRLGCKLGEPYGCMHLALELVNGTNVKKNPDEAVALYVEACDGGIPAACTHGATVLDTMGLAQRATHLYRRGCDAGDKPGCDAAAARIGTP